MKFDLIVIGSGPGGYVAAIRAAQLGMNVAIVEKYFSLGGTCLNVGCIPSKALLDSSKRFYDLSKLKEHGIDVDGFSVDIDRMISRKDRIVKKTCDGIVYLMKKNRITVFHGKACFENAKRVSVTDLNGEVRSIESKFVIIASGSKPVGLSNVSIDKNRIITSTEALSLKNIPKDLIVIGGGVIALEMGSIFNRLGTKVTVVEYASRVLPQMDEDISRQMHTISKKQGINFYLDSKVVDIQYRGDNLIVRSENNKNSDIVDIEGDICMVAIGRRPYVDGLGLDLIGVRINEKGFIITGDDLQTSVEGVYAIGDVIDKGAMLAHKASEEGIFVAEIISGQKPSIHYHLIPGVVYTWPEIASVGYTEKQLQDRNIVYRVGKFPFMALGRARCSDDLDGFIKVIVNQGTDEILGVHMIGARVADMVSSAVVAMEFRASSEDLTRMSFAHPTFSEAFKEACMDANSSSAIHI